MLIEEMLSLAKERSRRLVEAGEELQPFVIARTPEGTVGILIAQLNKDTFKQTLAGLLRLLKADAYLFITEGWMAEGNVGKRAMEEGKAISELPPDDRTEIVLINGCENGGAHIGCFAKIQTLRSERWLSDWQRLEGIAEGRMVLTRW